MRMRVTSESVFDETLLCTSWPYALMFKHYSWSCPVKDVSL